MDLHKITSLITQAAKAVEANEKVALPIVAAKARREAQARPTDVPLVNASQVLTKMASDTDRVFISKDELRGIVERFGASHSKLSEVFADELGKQPERKPHTFARDYEGGSLDQDYSKFADPLLSNALAGAFDQKPTEKLYTQADAERAQRAAHAQLLSIGIQAKDISTFAGRKDIIVCQATHETPQGQSKVLIPVELREGKAVLPTMFLSSAGFEDLGKKAYVAQVKRSAGKSFRVDGNKLLDILEQVKRGSNEINVVEMAAIKIASETGTPSVNQQNPLFAELENPQKDVELPKAAPTEESKFAETLGKPDGVARFVHGDRVVEAGRQILIQKLAEIGYTNVQVKVADVEEGKILYAVAIGTGTGLRVPLEVTGNTVAPPKIVFANGMVTAFSKQAISEMIQAGTGGSKRALAVASPCYDMKPTELLDVVKESVAEGNFIRAEEAINVLGEVDPHAQRVAIAHMMSNIYEPGQEPEKEIVEMQRIANQPVKDTPQFMTHKIFFPEGA